MFIQDLIHANIFFFVTTIAVVIIALSAVVITVYAVRILTNMYDFSKRIKEEGSSIMDDVSELRASLREEGVYLKNLAVLAKRILPRPKVTKKKVSIHHE